MIYFLVQWNSCKTIWTNRKPVNCTKGHDKGWTRSRQGIRGRRALLAVQLVSLMRLDYYYRWPFCTYLTSLLCNLIILEMFSKYQVKVIDYTSKVKNCIALNMAAYGPKLRHEPPILNNIIILALLSNTQNKLSRVWISFRDLNWNSLIFLFYFYW